MPNELDWPSFHETRFVLVTVSDFDCHPCKARVMFLHSIVPSSSKMKKGEDGESKRKKGREGKREGGKQRKSKRKEGKKKNGVKKKKQEWKVEEMKSQTRPH